MRPSNTFSLLWLALIAGQLLPGNSAAQNRNVYFHAGAGARALGAGGAFTAVANDVTAGYWNPAGLGEVAAPQLVGMYSALPLNWQHNYAAAAYPLGSAGAVAVSWIGFRLGNSVTHNPFVAVTGQLGNAQNTLLFSYGNQISENFALGGNVKLLFQNLAGASVSGMGFDLGAKFKASELLALGAGVQDLQPQVSWKIAGKGRKALPVNTRAGVNVKPLPFMNLAADYEFNDQQKGRWHAGWEIFLGDMYGLRAGSDDGAFTFGASLMRLEVGRNNLEVDYGFANDALVSGASHRLTVLLKFGNSTRGVAPPSQREKRAKHAAEETDYEKILAAREREKYGLIVEKSASEALATAEPEPAESPEQSTFAQILAADEQEETTAALAPAEERPSAALFADDLPTENAKAEDEGNAAMFDTAPEPAGAVTAPTFDERITALEAEANAGKKIVAQTVADENMEMAPAPTANANAELTFEEKMAQLEARTNTGESTAAETVSIEKVEKAPVPLATAAAELTFEEKMAQLDAQANAGVETVSHEKVEMLPASNAADAAELTFEEKMALLEAPTNARANAGGETAANESMGALPSAMATGQSNETRALPATPQDEVEMTTPQITYGNKNGLTIPAIAPGKRLGHSVAVLFQAQVVEARPVYWIINLGERAGFNTDMMVEIYQPTPDGETGRSYGKAQPVEVRSLYSVIKITQRRAKHPPAAGERVILKYLYPVVNY